MAASSPAAGRGAPGHPPWWRPATRGDQLGDHVVEVGPPARPGRPGRRTACSSCRARAASSRDRSPRRERVVRRAAEHAHRAVRDILPQLERRAHWPRPRPPCPCAKATSRVEPSSNAWTSSWRCRSATLATLSSIAVADTSAGAISTKQPAFCSSTSVGATRRSSASPPSSARGRPLRRRGPRPAAAARAAARPAPARSPVASPDPCRASPGPARISAGGVSGH